MHLDQFNYHLPEGLIAKHPPQNRTDARLLLFINEVIKHKQISALSSVITENDILVLNETSVIPARLFGTKETGGKVEVMLEKIIEDNRTLVRLNLLDQSKKNHLYILCMTAKHFQQHA